VFVDNLDRYCGNSLLSTVIKITVRGECLSLSGPAPLDPSLTTSRRNTLPAVLIQRVAFHVSLRLLFYHFCSFCRFLILNDLSCFVANCDHTSEWVHLVCTWIGIAMRWVTLQKSLLAFLLPPLKMQFSL
jgi:hypothetical protein